MTEREPAYGGRVRDGVLHIARPETEWLSAGWNGGRTTADATAVISVPTEWGQTDLGQYAADRLDRAGVECNGPVLFTGVDVENGRGAQYGSVTAYATAGLSNPAALPMEPTGTTDSADRPDDHGPTRGTVNVVVGTSRSLAAGALVNLIAVATEAKTATLIAETGFPGTTTDAIVAGHDPTGDSVTFSGSATDVGAATRACVREAVRAALEAHYDSADATLPASIEAATHGVETTERAAVFRPPIDLADTE